MNNKHLTAWFGLLSLATITGALFGWRPIISRVLPTLGWTYAYATVPVLATKTAWHTARFTPLSIIIRDAASAASFVMYVPVWLAGHRVCSDVS